MRLPSTEAAITAEGAFVRDRLEREISAAALLVPDKRYAVYYDVGSTFTCGGGSWPPDLEGPSGAL